MAPDLKVGYYVKIVGAGIDDKLWEIKSEEPFRYITGDESKTIFTAVASGSESGWKNIEPLEPDETPKHLFYVTWGVATGGKYQFKLPTAVMRLGTDEEKNIGYVDNVLSPYYAPNPDFAFWLISDFYPAINFINTTPETVTPKIWFIGKKYDIEEITDPTLKQRILMERKYSIVTIGGVKTGG